MFDPSSSIRLLDLATGKVARKLSAGHAGAVRALSFSADGRYLASSASSARFVNVFDVAGEAAPSEPVSTLSFEATPLYVALRASFEGGEGGDEVTVVAGFDTGGVSVLRTRRTGDGKGEVASCLVLRLLLCPYVKCVHIEHSAVAGAFFFALGHGHLVS